MKDQVAGHENDGPSKLQGAKMQHMKTQDVKMQDTKIEGINNCLAALHLITGC